MNWQTWIGIGALAGLAYLLLRGKGEGGDSGGFGGAFPLKTEQPGYPYSGGFPTTKKEYAAIDIGSPRGAGTFSEVLRSIPSSIPAIVNKPGEVFGAGISIPTYRPEQQKGFGKGQFGGRYASQEIRRMMQIVRTKKAAYGGGGAGAR